MNTIQGEKSFKQRLKTIIEDQNNTNSIFPERLKEKGVECSVLLPLFENVLGYDPIDDIQYELTSAIVYGQRFDFLLDNRFVVESKALNTPLTENIVKQITSYIAQNDDINYGMLSNGIEYAFFLQRTFIEQVANSGEIIVGAAQPVYNVLTLSADDEYFFDIISLFSKTSYDEAFSSIAKFVFRQLVPTKGPLSPIVSDRALDQYIKDLILKNMDFKRGYYLPKIRTGKYKEGQILCYQDKYVTIEIEIQSDGTVKLPKGGIKKINANEILSDGEFRPLLDLLTNWHDKDQIYEDPKDIFRQALGKQKIMSKYKFVSK